MRIRFIQLEQKIYSMLGVPHFRKAVLALEKLLHRKDNGRNVNYHIATFSLEDVSGFVKFFFYNGAIHLRNIIAMSLYILFFKVVLQKAFAWYDYVLIVFGIKDLYCVMLQRYNFLRLDARLKAMSQRRNSCIEQRAVQLRHNLQSYDMSKKNVDLEFIDNLRQAIVDGSDILITSDDLDILKRLSQLLKNKEV